MITVPAKRPRRVDKRSAVHLRRRGIQWIASSLVNPTAETMIKAGDRDGRRPLGHPGCRPESNRHSAAALTGRKASSLLQFAELAVFANVVGGIVGVRGQH